MTRPQGAPSAQGSLAARYARTRGDRFGLGRATITELDTDTGKQRCGVRPRVKRRVDAEPDDAKGRDDAGAPKNGAIKC